VVYQCSSLSHLKSAPGWPRRACADLWCRDMVTKPAMSSIPVPHGRPKSRQSCNVSPPIMQDLAISSCHSKETNVCSVRDWQTPHADLPFGFFFGASPEKSGILPPLLCSEFAVRWAVLFQNMPPVGDLVLESGVSGPMHSPSRILFGRT
jgi:hypothetical protein